MVVGPGQVGFLLARSLRARGHEVRVVRRTCARVPRDGVEVAFADASDPEEVARATDGAACAYHCARPGRTDWPRSLPWLTRGVVEGTRRSGVDLVVLDDLASFGRARSVDPGTPIHPCSASGAIRAESEAIVLDEAARGGRRVVLARSADLFGPGAVASPVLGEDFLRRLLAGKPASVYGDVDLPHSYAYLPDVVEGLLALGTSPFATGTYLLPVEPPETTRSVIRRFHEALGIEPGIGHRSIWALRIREFFSDGAEDVVDRLYQWQQPLLVDDARIRDELHVRSTPWHAAIQETLRWARRAYAPAHPGPSPRKEGETSCRRGG